MRKKPLIIIHIPKAAGSTLNSILKRKFSENECFFLDGKNPTQAIESFKNESAEFKSQLKFLVGHMDFGLHDSFENSADYFTIFREPVSRIISFYEYVKRTPKHYLFEIVNEKKLTLKEFVEMRLTPELHNGQIRILSGKGGFHAAEGAFETCTEEDFKTALSNLENHFIGFGLKEYFDESLLLLSQKANIGSVIYLKKNVSKIANSYEEKAIERIKEFNKWDILFYEKLKERFESQMENSQLKNSFEGKKLKFGKMLVNRFPRSRRFLLK